MNKEIGFDPATRKNKRIHLNISKVEAALCIALSAIVSMSLISWLLY